MTKDLTNEQLYEKLIDQGVKKIDGWGNKTDMELTKKPISLKRITVTLDGENFIVEE